MSTARNTSLHELCAAGQRRAVKKRVLKAKKRIERPKLLEERNEQGQTPLDVAVRNKHYDVVELLLGFGAKTRREHLVNIVVATIAETIFRLLFR